MFNDSLISRKPGLFIVATTGFVFIRKIKLISENKETIDVTAADKDCLLSESLISAVPQKSADIVNRFPETINDYIRKKYKTADTTVDF